MRHMIEVCSPHECVLDARLCRGGACGLPQGRTHCCMATLHCTARRDHDPPRCAGNLTHLAAGQRRAGEQLQRGLRAAPCCAPMLRTLTSLSCSIQGGGVRVNNEKVDDELHLLQESDLIDGRLVLIAAGKKNKMLVRVA